MSTVDLSTPIRLGPNGLANRVIMAPMTRNRAIGTLPGELHAEYYRQRSSAGLIITEAAQVSPQGIGYPNTPGAHSDAQIAGWKQVTDAVHAEGGKIFLQLFHVGRISHPSLQPDGEAPIAPSAIKPEGEALTYDGPRPYVTPRALEMREIPEIITQFASAARNGLAAGFDGIELHAANGYLIDQFLRSGTNRRADRYGGSLANRARFLLEVTEAVAAVVGAGRIGVRLSPAGGFNDMRDEDPVGTFDFVARELGRLGLAYLHVIEALESEKSFDFLQLRRRFDGPYMANDRYDYSRATEALASGRVDLVSFGKAFLANPDLPKRFELRAPLNEPDRSTFYGGDARGYTDYPFLDSPVRSAVASAR